jgi:hypothetical protein
MCDTYMLHASKVEHILDKQNKTEGVNKERNSPLFNP